MELDAAVNHHKYIFVDEAGFINKVQLTLSSINSSEYMVKMLSCGTMSVSTTQSSVHDPLPSPILFFPQPN